MIFILLVLFGTRLELGARDFFRLAKVDSVVGAALPALNAVAINVVPLILEANVRLVAVRVSYEEASVDVLSSTVEARF